MSLNAAGIRGYGASPQNNKVTRRNNLHTPNFLNFSKNPHIKCNKGYEEQNGRCVPSEETRKNLK